MSDEAPALEVKDKMTIIVVSGDLDKALAAFVIATGAAAMDTEVSMFFAFWGLNILRKEKGPVPKKDFLGAMFGKMMPRGANKLSLSKLNMMGMGSAMMKGIMKKKKVQSLPEMIKTCQDLGVRFVACTMSMDVMSISKEELLDGVELGGVATMLGDSSESRSTLFI